MDTSHIVVVNVARLPLILSAISYRRFSSGITSHYRAQVVVNMFNVVHIHLASSLDFVLAVGLSQHARASP